MLLRGSRVGRSLQQHCTRIALLLAGGPKPVLEIEREAIRAGILQRGVSISQVRAMRVAREQLGVQTIRTGGEHTEWLWALPH